MCQHVVRQLLHGTIATIVANFCIPHYLESYGEIAASPSDGSPIQALLA